MTFTISRGVLSLYILDFSINNLFLNLVKGIIVIFQGGLEFFREIYIILKDFFKTATKEYSQLPKYAQIGIPIALIAIPSLILMFSENARIRLKTAIINLKDNIGNLITLLSDSLKHLAKQIIDFFITLYPFFEIIPEIIGYLLYSTRILYIKINQLNRKSGSLEII